MPAIFNPYQQQPPAADIHKILQNIIQTFEELGYADVDIRHIQSFDSETTKISITIPWNRKTTRDPI